MNRNLYCQLIVFTATILLGRQSVLSEESHLTVAIVGYQQHQIHSAKDGNYGIPDIFIPIKPLPLEDNAVPNRRTAKPLYVVLRNTSKMPIRLALGTSNWKTCLQFQIMSGDGKTFLIVRHLGWETMGTAYGPEPWVFEPGGMRIFTVDFSSQLYWEGFPSGPDLPRERPFKIKATFRYRDPYEKDHQFDSDVITAVDGTYWFGRDGELTPPVRNPK